MVSFRSARPEEVEEVLELVDYVFRLSNGLEPSMGRQFPTFICAENVSNLYVAVDGGKIVAHIGIKKNTGIIYGHKLSMASMGAVCTHPHYRGRGIGTRLLHEVFECLNEEGIGLVIISGTRGLYRRNYCVETGGVVTFVFRRGKHPLENYSGIRYRIFQDADNATALFSIYRREEVRYQRAKWEFPVLFQAVPMVHPPVALTAVVALADGGNDADLAYLIGYENKPGIFKVVEYAGERWAIPWLIERLLEDKGMTEVVLEVPTYDRPLIAVLDSMGMQGTLSYYPSTTLRIVSQDSLWREIYPLIEELWEGTNPPCSMVELPDGVAHDMGALATFLFADFNRVPYGYPWDQVFPLPLPWPNGLNYI